MTDVFERLSRNRPVHLPPYSALSAGKPIPPAAHGPAAQLRSRGSSAVPIMLTLLCRWRFATFRFLAGGDGSPSK